MKETRVRATTKLDVVETIKIYRVQKDRVKTKEFLGYLNL